MLRKVISLTVALVLVVGVFGVANAQTPTIEQLQAMIAQLTAQLSALSGGQTVAPVAPTTFTRDLTIGSTGADVEGLQRFLQGRGFLVMPTGVAYGYFGGLTKDALAKYQAANGIAPAVGYFGPMTRANVNASAVVVVPPTIPTTPTTPTTPATPGTEGSFTAKLASTPTSNANMTVGNDKSVFGIEVKATDSEITVDRVDLQFAVTKSGSSVHPATFVRSIKLFDGSNLLVERDVVASDFERSGSDYYIRMTNIGFKVADGATKNLVVKVDTVTTLDTNRVLTVGVYGTSAIRGTDTLGLQDYGTVSGTRVHTFKSGDTSSVSVTVNANNPIARPIAVDEDDGVEDVTMLVFNVKSTTGDSIVRDIVVTATSSIATSSMTSLDLYVDGQSSPIASASVTASSAAAGATVTFEDIDLDISRNSTKTFTVKANFPALARGTSTVSLSSVVFEMPDYSTDTVTSSSINGSAVTLLAKAADVAFVSGTVNSPVTNPVTGTTTSMTGNLRVKITGIGGELVEPTRADFVVKAATTTGGTAITVTNVGFSVSPNNTNDIIGENVEATVTLSPTLTNAQVISSGTYFFFIESVKWQIVGETAVTQTAGLEDFKTENSQYFDK